MTSSIHGGRRYLPYVFTEQGVAMLSGVLRSDTAVQISIAIMTAFVEMRRFIAANQNLFARLDNIEHKQIVYQEETNHKFHSLTSAESS